ncbi:MAG: lysine transporter LysE [Candidatus Nitrosocaldaceae archaeon]|nr:MAG: lysine transporter LysE [Candidatus Nitrosocaldaceae archaeon]
MEMLEFAVTVMLVSSSGVLSPGPLLLSNIIHAKSFGYKSGLMISYGHTIVELPLVLLLAVSSLTLELFNEYNTVISVIGGIALLFFAISNMLSKIDKKPMIHKPIISGIVFSAFNPFFIAWWLTIGMKLINDSLLLTSSILGVFLMFIMHIWMDYAWLSLTAYITNKGISMLNNKYYKYILLGLNFIMIYFGINFLLNALQYV